jgi:hypothetical protein
MTGLEERLAGLEDAEFRLWAYHWPDDVWVFWIHTPYARQWDDPRQYVLFNGVTEFSAPSDSLLGNVEHVQLEDGKMRFRSASTDIVHESWEIRKNFKR